MPETIQAPIDLNNIAGITGEITQQDIDEGVFCNSEQCALAQALWRMFPGCVVHVLDIAQVSRKGDHGDYADIHFSDEIFQWINDFDNELPVNPIGLRVDKGEDPTTDWILQNTGPLTL